MLVRAVLALGLGFAITFSTDHSAALGATLFGVFALLSVVAGAALPVRPLSSAAPRIRALSVAQLVVGLLAGSAALLLREAGIGALVVVLAAYGVVAGAIELVTGILLRGTEVLARDQAILGALTVLFGIAVLCVPVGLAAPYSGVDPDVSGVLTSSIIDVGLLGAWGVISGVLLAIAAVTVRGARVAADPASDAGATR